MPVSSPVHSENAKAKRKRKAMDVDIPPASKNATLAVPAVPGVPHVFSSPHTLGYVIDLVYER